MEQLTVTLDVKEAQKKLAEVSWQYRHNWLWYKNGYYGVKALQVLFCLLIFITPSCFSMGMMKAGIVCVALLVLSVVGIVKIPKRQKERFFGIYQRDAEAVIERNGTNLLTYELSQAEIVKTGANERRIQWSDIHGYFQEEGWLGMFLIENGKRCGFIMIPEATLTEEEQVLLQKFLEENVTEKEINWKKVH